MGNIRDAYKVGNEDERGTYWVGTRSELVGTVSEQGSDRFMDHMVDSDQSMIDVAVQFLVDKGSHLE